MSKKHYITVARLIADEVEKSSPAAESTRLGSISDIARGLADLFASDNPRFDRQRFYFACALDDNGRPQRPPSCDGRTAAEHGAYELGCEHARTAASWVADGNTSQEHIVSMLWMFDAGDPEADDYLPRRPNLSGEYAGDPTPSSLFETITGLDAHAEASFNGDAYGSVVEGLCEAYEQGVSETFEAACEAELRSLDTREAR